MANNQPLRVHLVGSVPLANAETVFRTTDAILGSYLRRLPDGETGSRSDWIGWQFQVLADTPHLVVVPPTPGRYAARPHVQLEAGANSDTLSIGSLGYASAAIHSYTLFSRLKQQGVLSARYRFQVSLPTPLAVMTAFVNRSDRAVIEPLYEQRFLEELHDILDAIPHQELAIQWDLPMEMGMIEGVIPSHLEHPTTDILSRLTRLSMHIPAAVELGYHLCYGDNGGHHFKQPQDTAVMVEVANALTTSVARPIQWFHMPVPRDRSDDAYFAPLRSLVLRPETELYLGLVHDSDGVEGTRERIRAAQRAINDFGIATECGLGRRNPETVLELLRIHALVANTTMNEGESND